MAVKKAAKKLKPAPKSSPNKAGIKKALKGGTKLTEQKLMML